MSNPLDALNAASSSAAAGPSLISQAQPADLLSSIQLTEIHNVAQPRINNGGAVVADGNALAAQLAAQVPGNVQLTPANAQIPPQPPFPAVAGNASVLDVLTSAVIQASASNAPAGAASVNASATPTLKMSDAEQDDLKNQWHLQTPGVEIGKKGTDEYQVKFNDYSDLHRFKWHFENSFNKVVGWKAGDPSLDNCLVITRVPLPIATPPPPPLSNPAPIPSLGITEDEVNDLKKEWHLQIPNVPVKKNSPDEYQIRFNDYNDLDFFRWNLEKNYKVVGWKAEDHPSLNLCLVMTRVPLPIATPPPPQPPPPPPPKITFRPPPFAPPAPPDVNAPPKPPPDPASVLARETDAKELDGMYPNRIDAIARDLDGTNFVTFKDKALADDAKFSPSPAGWIVEADPTNDLIVKFIRLPPPPPLPPPALPDDITDLLAACPSQPDTIDVQGDGSYRLTFPNAATAAAFKDIQAVVDNWDVTENNDTTLTISPKIPPPPPVPVKATVGETVEVMKSKLKSLKAQANQETKAGEKGRDIATIIMWVVAAILIVAAVVVLSVLTAGIGTAIIGISLFLAGDLFILAPEGINEINAQSHQRARELGNISPKTLEYIASTVKKPDAENADDYNDRLTHIAADETIRNIDEKRRQYQKSLKALEKDRDEKGVLNKEEQRELNQATLLIQMTKVQLDKAIAEKNAALIKNKPIRIEHVEEEEKIEAEEEEKKEDEVDPDAQMRLDNERNEDWLDLNRD